MRSLLDTKLCRDEQRTGCYMAIALADGRIQVGFNVGEPPIDKVLRYWRNAGEKAVRLGSHRLAGHTTSRESADIDKEMYPGAIYAPKTATIFSVSGFHPDADEALAWYTAVAVDDMTIGQAIDEANRVGNKFAAEWVRRQFTKF
ncbi:MAG: hypothetical protein A2854_00475 [Parcubacteria group bacterium RIFCSPHIGHO2_01_FULL_56_18]|nr:MAG: hypothetical protein A2854_00475 [Parcubacteria group bacterium RIFCSPHIGHO2_01_FULL_56_18]